MPCNIFETKNHLQKDDLESRFQTIIIYIQDYLQKTVYKQNDEQEM